MANGVFPHWNVKRLWGCSLSLDKTASDLRHFQEELRVSLRLLLICNPVESLEMKEEKKKKPNQAAA